MAGSILSELFIKIGVDDQGVEKKLDTIGGKIGQLGEIIEALGKLAAFKEVVERVSEVVVAFDEARESIARATGAIGAGLTDLTGSLSAAMRGGIEAPVEEASAALSKLNVRFDLTGEALTEATKSFAEFAEITGQEIPGAVEGVANVMSAWNIPATEMTKTLDQLVVVQQKSGAEIGQLSAQLASSGPVFKQLGLTFEESAAMLATFEKSGLGSEVAIKGLNMGLANFAKAGVDPTIAFRQLTDAIKGAPSVMEATQLAVDALGAKAGPKFAEALRNGSAGIATLTMALGEADGAMERTGEAGESIAAQMAALGNAVQTIVADAFQAFVPIIKQVLTGVKALVDAFGALPAPVKNAAVVFGTVAVALKLLAGAGDIVAKVAPRIGAALTAMGGPIGLAIAAAAGLVAGFVAISDWVKARDVERARTDFAELAGEVKAAGGNVDEFIEKALKVEQAGKDLGNAWADYNTKARELSIGDRLISAIPIYGAIYAAQQNITLATEAQADASKTLEERVGETAQKYGLTRLEVVKVWQASSQISTETKVALNTMREQLIVQQELGAAYRSYADGYKAGAAYEADFARRQAAAAEQLGNITRAASIGALNWRESQEQIVAQASAEVALYQERIRISGGLTTAMDTLYKAAKARLATAQANLSYDAASAEALERQATAEAVSFGLEERRSRIEEDRAKKKKAAGGIDFSAAAAAMAKQKAQEDAMTKRREDDARKVADAWLNATNTIGDAVQRIGGGVKDLFASIGARLIANEDAALAKSLESIDENTKRKLAAAGLVEQTTQEKLAAEVAEARAAGDAELANEKQKELDRTRIVEEAEEAKAKVTAAAEKKKAQIKYQADHASWVASLALATASAAQAIISSMVSLPWPANLIAAGVTGAATGVQLAAMAASEPQMPSFRMGTTNARGGVALVGEAGPELVRLPRGAAVDPAGVTRAKLGGGGGGPVSITIQSPVAVSPVEADRLLRQTMRELSFQGAF